MDMSENNYKLLEELKIMFFKGSYKLSLQPNDVSYMTWEWQQKLLAATVNSDLVQKYPVSRAFTRLFLKKIIEQLEGYQEIHDDFYTHLCLVMNNNAAQDCCYRHYLIKNHRDVITIKETNKMVVNGTTGMRTWEAALMLADWALSQKEMFHKKTIMELGSGVGFTGVTIGKLCQPRCMYLSDCHPEVIKTICENIRINFPQSEVTENNGTTLFKDDERIIGAIPLDWNHLEDLPNNIVPDIVIGADIVYDPSILQPLCDVLNTLFKKNNHLEVYIASVIRNEETFASFLKHLDKMEFVHQKLPQNECVFIEWDHNIEHCLLKINC